MFRFEELNVYKSSIEFSNSIYELTKSFPREELFGLSNQLRRASVSITLNIAEGSSRSKKDFRHFLGLSRGSCYECVAILEIAKNQDYISNKVYKEFYEKILSLSKMLSSLRTSLL